MKLSKVARAAGHGAAARRHGALRPACSAAAALRAPVPLCSHFRLILCAAALLAAVPGCERQPPAPTTSPSQKNSAAGGVVVVYTALDEPFARDLLGRFERASGIRVEALYDTEGGKTTGFLRRLAREMRNPRCDVWFSNEVFGTVELARLGALAPYEPPTAADIPALWKDREARWTAVAARARVLAYRTDRYTAAQLPATWRELAAAPSLARFALANPQFGTTRGHMAALFALWGDTPATDFVRRLARERATLADGNGHVVRLVASGAADMGMTDTDDVLVAQQRGDPLDMVYPRVDAEGPILWIPCSAALVQGGPNPAAARQLIDYLVSAAAEEALYASPARHIPVRPALRERLDIPGPAPEPLDFTRIADALEPSAAVLREALLR